MKPASGLDRNALTRMLMESGEAAPEEKQIPAAEGPPGEEAPAPAESPEGGGEGAAPEEGAAPANDLSQEDGGAEEASSVSAKVQKRFDVLTARIKAAEERNAELEAKLREKPEAAPAAAAAGPNPFSECRTDEDVRKARTNLLRFRSWANRNPNGGEFDGKQYDETQLGETAEMVEQALDPEVGWLKARAQEIAVAAQVRQRAQARWTWLNDRSTAQYQAYQEVLTKYPQLRSIPMIDEWLPRVIESYQTEQRTKAAPVAAPAAVPRAASRPAAAPVAVPAATAAMAAARNAFKSAPNRETLAKMIELSGS